MIGLVLVGCGLLTPYPGGEDPGAVLGGSSGAGGRSPFDTGMPQEPLIDPAEDATINVVPAKDLIVANEGQAFTVELGFTAAKSNVVGGGIQFDGEPEIQWTFIEGLEGMPGGVIRFGYVVETGTCERIGNLCREVGTKQFAVGANADNADVDGDGEPDGDFVVSPPKDVRIILRCASCDSPSCIELLEETPEACIYCEQPALCGEVFEMCFAPGAPLEDSDEAASFDQLLGPDGIAWKNAVTCADGENLCMDALERFMDDCAVPDTDGMMTTGAT